MCREVKQTSSMDFKHCCCCLVSSVGRGRWSMCRRWFLLNILAVLLHQTAADCTFPTALQNANYTSSNFGNMEFQTSTVSFTEDDVAITGVTSWTCNISSGDNYVIKSDQTITIIGLSGFLYYCLSLTKWTDNSFSYYLLSTLDNGKRRKSFQETHLATVAEVCDDTLDAAEFNVMVKTASPDSAKSYCAEPLLGDFIYTFKDGFDSTEKCGASPGDGALYVCTDTSRNSLVFNYTACSQQVGFSTGGVLYCIAYTSSTSGSTTTYYQSLYNADASAVTQFTCMAVSSGTDADGVARVYVSQTASSCSAGQTSTTPPDTTGDTLVLTANVTCPIETITTTPGDSVSSVNVGLIAGLVVAGLLLLAVIAGLLFFFCYWKKRDPNAGKPIVENTKPRFEDPDKEDISMEEIIDIEDNASTIVTRDDITFEAGSPSLIPNGKPVSLSNGAPVGNQNKGSYVTFNGGPPTSPRRDSGIALTEKSSDRPTPRIGINPSKEAMVIFNGDEKVISGNDSRIIPAENPSARTFRTMNPGLDPEIGIVSLTALEENEVGDSVTEMTPREYPYPSLPREKSNLMPPIETIDPEKEKHE